MIYEEHFFNMHCIARKSSEVKTEECPVWDYLKLCYVESDEKLRERLVNTSKGINQ